MERVFEPAGGRVAYVASEDGLDRMLPGLYVVPEDGSGPSLNLRPSPVHPLIQVLDLVLTADAAVHLSDELEPGRFELFASGLDGAGPRRLSASLVPGGTVRSFRVTPDGRRVVYLADQDTYQVPELFSVAVRGGAAPVKLHADLPAGRSVHEFALSPDGTRVAFLVDGATSVELRSAPADGSLPDVLLSGAPPAGPGCDDVHSFEILADSARVVFRGCLERNGVAELFVAPLDGSAPRLRLSHDLPLAGNVQVVGHKATPDGGRVVYLTQRGTRDPSAHVVGTDGSNLVRGIASDVAPHAYPGPPALLLAFPAGGSTLVFRSAVDGTFQVVPLDGSSPPVRVGDPASPGQWALTPDGKELVYVNVERGPFAALEGTLWTVPVEPAVAGAPALRLSDVPAPSNGSFGNGVFGFRLAPDGRSAVFASEENGTSRLELSPVDGSVPPLRLDEVGDGATLLSSWEFFLAEDGEHVLFATAPQPVPGLWSVPLPGATATSTSPVRTEVRAR